MTDQITIRGARLHNLKNIDVSIPKNKLIVLTGISGSGKSTLGFDLLLKEGQRQYLESLGLIAFGYSKPPVDSISGISPTISVDQHLTNQSPRSTVGTATDVFTYLRVLFARLGHRPCPTCGKDVPPLYSPDEIEWDDDSGVNVDAAAPEETFPCPHCGAPIPELSMASFSFNKPAGACPTCTGLGTVQQADLNLLVDAQKSILGGAVLGWDSRLINYHSGTLQAAARHYGIDLDLSLPLNNYSPEQHDLLFFGVESPQLRRRFPNIKPPEIVRKGRFEGIATSLLRRYAEHLHEHIHDADYRDKLEEFLITDTCPDCEGTRLRAESRTVTVDSQAITAIAKISLNDLGAWVNHLRDIFNPEEMNIARPIIDDLNDRIGRLTEVGAGYLSLERSSPTLSAGESQRLRLASLLGSGLTGVLYVIDEPTIGLHQRDTRRLISILRRLRDLGNTVLVIEHDLETIAAADYVIDLGPGAGKNGGKVVAAGTPAEVAQQPDSQTGYYLSGRSFIPVPRLRRTLTDQFITIRGARHHNLQNITLKLPLGLLVAVTGVSGSGKSSLIFDTLDRAMRQHLNKTEELPGEYDSIDGYEHLDRIITVDQSPIGRIPRSNVATYTDIFTPIRDTYAAVDEAQRLGFSAKHFSFNVPGGRCERCEGAGTLTVKMHFLPDVEVRCPACHGRRYKREVLGVKFNGHDISEVLEMTVAEAYQVFKDIPAVCSRLKLLVDVGLDYLQLGQRATTISAGEAQRVKLSKELGRRSIGRVLYLLDEPTTGLHLADIARLLDVLQRLVDAGNSVIVIEHNLELIKTADWIIDLGPEGGDAGGNLIAEGTPEQVAQVPASYTGQFLREVFSAPRIRSENP